MADESTLRVFFSDSERDVRKSAVASRKDISKRESVFAAAAELPAEGGKVEFTATGHANCRALEQYFKWAGQVLVLPGPPTLANWITAAVGRTGVLPGEACRTSPAEVISDLTAWGVPRKKWPPSLKLMTKKLEWSEALGAEVKRGILDSVQVRVWAKLQGPIHLHLLSSRTDWRKKARLSSFSRSEISLSISGDARWWLDSAASH